MTDEQLMAEYGRTQDSICFNELYKRHATPLLNFLDRYIFGDHAEDVSQVTWSLVHEYRHQFDPAYSFRNWLYMMAAKQAQRWVQKVDRLKTFGELGDGWDETLIEDIIFDDADTIESVKAHINTLPTDQREVIKARFFDALPQKDVAATLGTYQMRVHRLEKQALDTLRRELCEAV